MKKVNITVAEYETRQPKTDEQHFSMLGKEAQEKHVALYNEYSNLLTEYFIKNFCLAEYDEALINSSNSYPLVPSEKMDIYQRKASSALRYFYIRNSLHVERLTPEEQAFLLGKTTGEDIILDEETEQFISNTFRKIMLDDPENLDPKIINYGPDNNRFMAPTNSIVIGLRYDDYQRLPGETPEEWDEANGRRIHECDILMKIMTNKMTRATGIPTTVIKYNEFSVKKTTEYAEGEKTK